MITWVMCRPVRAKKVPPNSGTPQGFLNGVTCSLLIRFIHSDQVQDHERAAAGHGGQNPAGRPPCGCRGSWQCTAITIVKLLESRQNVMTLEKMMLGEKWNGFGQSGLETRLYV